MNKTMRAGKQITKKALLTLAMLLLLPAGTYAAQTSSSHYQLNEVFFGAGGSLHSCSSSYCSKQSAGELAVGNARSNNYQARAGFNTDRYAYIEASVSNTNVDLGTLTAATTATANSTFTVKAHLAHGYSVVNASSPPTNGTYTMQAMGIPDASNTGSEQFGINLAANTIPATFGANPVQTPDSSFSYGQVSADYSSPNMYKYAKGDTIAFSTSSTSATTYTVSYIFNISNLTPGGQYVLHHVVVATATY